jgi:hypothetical protein
LPPLKVWVFEVHVILLFQDFRHFAELVHVQLPDERRQMFVPEVFGQHFFLKLFRVLYQDLVVAEPRQVVFVLFFLD